LGSQFSTIPVGNTEVESDPVIVRPAVSFTPQPSVGVSRPDQIGSKRAGRAAFSIRVRWLYQCFRENWVGCSYGGSWPAFDKDRFSMSQPQKDHQCAIDAQLIGVLELT
jgi:hypothetical protein